MQIILLDNILKLGNLGEVIRVRDGYARNFLIPKGLAKRATQSAVAEFESRRNELEKLAEKKPGEVLKLAVKRMLPGGVLGKKQLTKLKIYSGNEHPHTAQKLKKIELDKLNNKNIIRN